MQPFPLGIPTCHLCHLRHLYKPCWPAYVGYCCRQCSCWSILWSFDNVLLILWSIPGRIRSWIFHWCSHIFCHLNILPCDSCVDTIWGSPWLKFDLQFIDIKMAERILHCGNVSHWCCTDNRWCGLFHWRVCASQLHPTAHHGRWCPGGVLGDMDHPSNMACHVHPWKCGAVL